MKMLLSIVVPVFNEEENVHQLYAAVVPVLEKLADCYDAEIIFTDNHSTDQTFVKLSQLADRDPRVRVFRFSRNCGYQRSIFTGYSQARGDVAIQLDCDLQDPPELILEFVKKWEEGYQVVYGVRRSRREAWWINRLRSIFYWLISVLSEDDLPRDVGDFRLVDRRLIDILKQIRDYQPYLRGTIAAMGFRQIGIPYDRNERERGTSKFSLSALVRIAIDGILNHSIAPLRLATYTGLVVSVLTCIGIFVYVFGKIVFGQEWPAGFATTTVLILLSLSLNALFLGIIGEYLGRIYQQVKWRPLVIIEEKIDRLDPDPNEHTPTRK